MSDVLSAEEVLRLDIDFDPDGDWAKAEASWAALARSHEQLRGERDAAVEEAEALERMGRSYNDLWRQEKERAEAAVRAGGCAADLAEALRKIAYMPFDVMVEAHEDLRDCKVIAADALAAYDRAVSGQTAEKEEA